MKNIAFLFVICQLYFLQSSASCPAKCHCETKEGEFNKPSSGSILNCTEAGLKDISSLNFNSPVIYVDLSHNTLTELKNSSFSDEHLANVQQIDLKSNRISHIDIGTFHGLRHLRVIDLENNDLSVIQPDLFATNTRLSFLTLTGNSRLVLSDGSWNIPSLIWLDLSECGLKTIPHQFFALMTKIESIYLSKNQLSHIDSLTLRSVAPTVTTFSLFGNRFTKIQDEILQDLPSSCVVDMYDNPFHCDCDFQRAYSLLKQRGPITIQLRCATPENMERTRGDDVQATLRCNGTKITSE